MKKCVLGVAVRGFDDLHVASLLGSSLGAALGASAASAHWSLAQRALWLAGWLYFFGSGARGRGGAGPGAPLRGSTGEPEKGARRCVLGPGAKWVLVTVWVCWRCPGGAEEVRIG